MDPEGTRSIFHTTSGSDVPFGVTLDAGWEFGPLELQYLDTEGSPIRPEEIGRFARVELEASSDLIVADDPDDGGDLTFHVLGQQPGDAELDSRLVQKRTGRVLWKQSLFQAHARRVWRGFPDGPNGRVNDLVTTADGLVVGGCFTSVGGFTAYGVALWTRDG